MEININGFEYHRDEVLEALKNKGYLIFKQKFLKKQKIRDIQAEENEIYALKGPDLPNESTKWYQVAYREFKKSVVKPPLG